MKRLTRDHTVGARRNDVLPPAITIEPGETILVETINHMTPIVRTEADLHPRGTPEYREREETGPIAVLGAEPGDALAVRIDRIDLVGLPHALGWGLLTRQYPQRPTAFPVEHGRCRLPGGLSVPVSCMIGDIYTAPASLDAPYPYGDHGGNMDFVDIRPGHTLYLPVFQSGGLLVLGDVHAFQGDGELFGEGGECAADVTLTIDIDRRYRHPRPLVETPDRLIGLACRGGLYDSTRQVLADMTGLLARVHGLSEPDAYVYCAMAGSLRLAGCLASQKTEQTVLAALDVPKPSGAAPSDKAPRR
jgi:amidase